MSKIAVIIIHYGKLETTKNCLTSLKNKIADNQLILINNTPDQINDLTKIIPNTKLIKNKENLGFAKAVNQGITLALSDPTITHVCLMNNDLELTFGTFKELLQTYSKSKMAGIVSPVLHHAGGYDWGGKYRPLTALVKHTNWENKPKTTLQVDHVAGAAMLISRELIDKIGMFDERFFLYYEDLDYCLRAKAAGYTIHINPSVVAEHAVSAGTSSLKRTLHQWKSHIFFVAKYLPKRALPTAILTDLLFYPLITLKSMIKK